MTIDELKGAGEQGSPIFDLGYIPRKYHIIFLFYLRMNRHLTSLQCRGINLKADLIRNLLRDFVHLIEFTLTFSRAETKKRDIGPLSGAVLTQWKEVSVIHLENFQFNCAQFADCQFYQKLTQSKLRHLVIGDAYLYSTKLYNNPLNLKMGRQPNTELSLTTFPNNETLQT